MLTDSNRRRGNCWGGSVYAFSAEIGVFCKARKCAGKNNVVARSRVKLMAASKGGMSICKKKREYFCDFS